MTLLLFASPADQDHMFGYFPFSAEFGIWDAPGYVVAGFVAVALIGATRFTLYQISSRLELWSAESSGQGASHINVHETRAGLRTAVSGNVPRVTGPVTPNGIVNGEGQDTDEVDPDRRPALTRQAASGAQTDVTADANGGEINSFMDRDHLRLPQQVGIMHSGMLTINYVHLSEPFKAQAERSLADQADKDDALAGTAGTTSAETSITGVCSAIETLDADADGFCILEHTAVMSTQFDNTRRVVSTTEASAGFACMGDDAQLSPGERLERMARLEKMENACIEMGVYQQAAAALSAQIRLHRQQYGTQHTELAPLYLRLADLSISLGRPEDAAHCQLRALEIQGLHGILEQADALQVGTAIDLIPFPAQEWTGQDCQPVPLSEDAMRQFSSSILGLSFGLKENIPEPELRNTAVQPEKSDAASRWTTRGQ